jgi:NTP pyrophosphatase (non-canonical NTP hydrolase)
MNDRELPAGTPNTFGTVADAGQILQQTCHHLAASWWLDTETGEDVRSWPPKFFKLWLGAKLMLIVTEVAEAMEGLRKGKSDDHLPDVSMLEAELADTIIRAFDMAGGLGFKLGETLARKLAYNAQRADHKIENRTAAGGKSI